MDPQLSNQDSGTSALANLEERVASLEPTDDNELSGGFSWQASEYVHHDKPESWYIAVVGIAVFLSGGFAWLDCFGRTDKLKY